MTTEQIVIKSSPLAISSQKMALVMRLIRQKDLDCALKILRFVPKKGGRIIHKLLQGAAKNLTSKQEKTNDFFLSKIEVNQARTLKKLLYRAKGRADRIRKRYCSVNLYLGKKLWL